MRRIKSNNKGFSLVELIAAVAILGVVCTPLIRSFAISYRTANRAVEISEASIAGQNVLEAFDARPVSEFQGGDASGIIGGMLGSGNSAAGIYPLGEVEEDGSFEVAIDNARAGNSVYDIKVSLSPGDNPEEVNVSQSTSSGLFVINDKPIAQYANMDAVSSQSNISAKDPDQKVETFMQTYVSANSDTVSSKPIYKSRLTTLTITEKDGLINGDLRYNYTYKYTNLKNGKTIQKTKTYSYNIFPGGYKPVTKDGSIAVYIMYRPFYPVVTNVDSSGNVTYERVDTDTEYGADYFRIINQNTARTAQAADMRLFLYKQQLPEELINAYNSVDGLKYTGSIRLVNPSVPKFVSASADRKALVYTNATLQLQGENQIPDFTFGVFTSTTDVYPDTNYIRTIDGELVRKEKQIRIYNIKIEIYKGDSFIQPETLEDGTVSDARFADDAKVIYTVEGSKTN